VFSDGNLKVRGIELRRHDTPQYFADFQAEILKIMARGDTAEQVRLLMPKVQEIFLIYASRLKERQVAIRNLLFTKQTSKDAGQYKDRNTIENSSIAMLAKEGRPLKAGQALRYVITDYYSKNPAKRTVPEDLISEETSYDVERYIELLAEVCSSVTEPFGFDVQGFEETLAGRTFQ
jgi:DNA polymerase-2